MLSLRQIPEEACSIAAQKATIAAAAAATYAAATATAMLLLMLMRAENAAVVIDAVCLCLVTLHGPLHALRSKNCGAAADGAASDLILMSMLP